MAGIFGLLMSGAGVLKDQYFNLTSLLLPGNGTNGAQNNTFLDSGTANSGSGFTITRNGDTTQGTFSPFSQTGWGNYFDGTGDSLSIADNAAFSYGTGDFTIETWVYPAGLGTTRRLYFHQTTSTTQLTIYQLNTNYVGFFVSSGGTTLIDILSNTLLPGNAWSHIAVVRNGNSFVIYQNGVSVASTTSSATMPDPTGPLYIGALDTGSDSWLGYLSNYRIVKGTAVYTGAFTPPTSPLTAISGTSLLTCQSNRFKDSSSTPLTVTPSGNTSVTPFSPFAPTSSYSAAAVGGSGYFDGSGDFLTVANSAALSYGTGSFTIEGWFYTAATGQYASIFSDEGSGGTAGLTLLMNPTVGNGQLTLYGNGGLLVTATGKYNDNAWHHFAISRDSTNLRLYVDGAYIGNSASGSTNFDASQPLYLMSSSIAGRVLSGYLSSFRTLKGTALYTGTGSITVPTAPLTNITNTSLLLNFTNAGVVDATAKNVLETEGNAQISTAQSKWGGGSMYFDGTANTAVKLLTGNQLSPFSGDYTYECWVYFNSFTGVPVIFDTRASNGAVPGLQLSCSTGGVLTLYGGASTATLLITGGTLSTGQWYYVALVRSGSGSNNTKLYLNGSQSGSSVTDTTNYNNQGGYIGAIAGGANNYVNGYIDDFRFTRYARTITASPTAPFPVQ